MYVFGTACCQHIYQSRIRCLALSAKNISEVIFSFCHDHETIHFISFCFTTFHVRTFFFVTPKNVDSSIRCTDFAVQTKECFHAEANINIDITDRNTA